MEEKKDINKLIIKNDPKSNIQVLKMVLEFSKQPGNNQYDVNEFISKLIEDEENR